MVVGMVVGEQVFRMAIPTKENTSLINDMDRANTSGTTVESTMDNSQKTNVTARVSLLGPMVRYTKVLL